MTTYRIDYDECGRYVGFRLALDVLFRREIPHEGDLEDFEPALDEVAEIAEDFLENQFYSN